MHLSSHRIRRLTARLRDERGFTMIAVLGMLAAAMALGAAAFAAAGGDVHLSRDDQDQKRAYAAAEAGVQDYFFHLTQNNSYWARCVDPDHPALNQKGARPLRTRPVPGSRARYAIELLPANGRTSCDTNDAEASMIVAEGPQAGTFSIRATGFSGGVKRRIVATFRRRSFLDYLYFTDMETSDPAFYILNANGRPTRSGNARTNRWRANSDLPSWAAESCPRYWRGGRGSQQYPVSPDTHWQQQLPNGTWGTATTTVVRCTEIQFVEGDAIEGPLHTNDDILVCGRPRFGRNANDNIEVSGSGWRSNCSGSQPNVRGTWKPNSPVLTPPPSDTALKRVVQDGYLFRGRTSIVLQGQQMTVTNPFLSPTTQTLPFPGNGVVYVDHADAADGGCPVTAYNPIRPYDDPLGCGDAYVQGTYSADLTIASAKDVIVRANVVRDGDSMLGLIANNFVRVYHPVLPNPRNPDDRNDCVNDASTPRDIRIDAAILALNHSFTVDSYFCGAPLGTLTVRGTIAQKFRGPVGRGSGTSISHGYFKDYEYDDRLRLREPPHFIDPVQSSWRLQRYAEQVGGD